MYACGFRVSELIKLKIADLNIPEGIGYVRQSKGGKDRMFNIPEFLVEDINYQIKLQGNEKYLFSGRNGKLSTRNLQKIVSSAAKRAGLRGVHCRSEERRVGKECRSRWSPYQ